MINVNDLKEKFILPVYKDAYNSDKPYIVIKGGGCSGKSYFVTSMLILDTFSEKRNSSLIVAIDFEAFHVKVDQIEMVLNDMGVRDLFDFNRREGVLKNKETGNEVRVSRIEDAKTYVYAAGADKVWFDDASMFSESEVEQIDRITKAERQIIFTLNPIISGCVPWLINTFFESEYAEDNYTLSTTYKDNPYAPEDIAWILEGFKNTSEFYYKTYCLGEFVPI